MILLIDDMRDFKKGVKHEYDKITTVRTSREALALLKENIPYDEIWFDFDLGIDYRTGKEDTARDVGRFLEPNDDNCWALYPVKHVFIHTSSPWGRNELKQALKAYNPTVVNAEGYFIYE